MEFTFYPNGLIYSDPAINKLRTIADSLQKKFRHLPDRDYYSIRQGRGHYIRMDTGDMAAAAADIQRGISYEDFVKKYGSEAKIDSFVLATENDWQDDYNHRTIAQYTDVMYDGPMTDAYFDISHNRHGDIVTQHDDMAREQDNWVFSYTKLYGKTKERLRAFYFLQPPSSPKIPASCARLIFYTDYMADTATDIHYKDAWYDGIDFRHRPEPGPALTLFRQYLDKETGVFLAKNDLVHPKFAIYTDSLRHTHFDTHWFAVDSLIQQYIKDSLSGSPEFQGLLSQADSEALSLKSFTDDDFEYYTAKYYSSSAALAMERNRIKMYTDNPPPWDNMNIATLAAESANWSVFLKAHLYIMGVGYRGRRISGIKELEAMDIRVPDLLLGMGLQTAHRAKNHPFRGISDLGRELTEVTNKKGLEKEILAMIRDRGLDDYNRLLLHYLFLNYLFFLPDKDSRMAGLQQLEEADKRLPAYLAAKIKTDQAVIEKGDKTKGFPDDFYYSHPYRPWVGRPDLYGIVQH